MVSFSRNCPSTVLIAKVKTYLDGLFTIKDLGSARFFLGLQIARSSLGTSVTQVKYIHDIINDTGLSHANVQQLSQFLQHPCEESAALHVVKYLKGSSTQGFFFPVSNSLELRAYCDADWASCVDSRKSLTGYYVFLGNALEFQVTVSLPISMYCDNKAALHIMANLVFHECMKHLHIDCHIVRNQYISSFISPTHVCNKDQLADLFTKSLPGASFARPSTTVDYRSTDVKLSSLLVVVSLFLLALWLWLCWIPLLVLAMTGLHSGHQSTGLLIACLIPVSQLLGGGMELDVDQLKQALCLGVEEESGFGRLSVGFDKNVLVLSCIGENENPMQVDLNWCEFHVHVNDLPLSKMNLGIAIFIGNEDLTATKERRANEQNLKKKNTLVVQEPRLGLHGMDYSGNQLTWCNGRETPHTVRGRLDRACCTVNWSLLCPKSHVQHDILAKSDHLVLWISLEQSTAAVKSDRKKSFPFERGSKQFTAPLGHGMHHQHQRHDRLHATISGSRCEPTYWWDYNDNRCSRSLSGRLVGDVPKEDGGTTDQTTERSRSSIIFSRLDPDRATILDVGASGRKRGLVFGLGSKAHHMIV
ncbi:UNVERIFIED_CONTAM: putative mitochondrial protein [Sesamum calycinum]|uniref:Mitochondrial protein n=1 Tax=Sesamum calycinum TaxID=2727403 RepID=A0AAW2KLT3_9LAMI